MEKTIIFKGFSCAAVQAELRINGSRAALLYSIDTPGFRP